ncbi:mannose-6-phosphate isomerase, class I [Microbacterium sp.]|uniref:mannose-6-phosphate isomerase, class I n=1 Tax=Microbacterium sp. TaxID=51671 RepID=UPI0039E69AB5
MLVPLSNVPRDYAWGSPTLIAELAGRAPSGRPEAEVWLGDHPGCPSRIEDGTGRTLDALLADLGAPPLTYLLKLLAAASPLSIQVHPSKEQAAAGFAREEAMGIPRDAAERTYRDPNHKPELIVAISDTFHALVGLRPLAATRRLVAALGGGPGAAALRGRLEGDDEAEVLRGALGWLLSGDARVEVADLIAALETATSTEFAAELATARRIAAANPGDPGVVVGLLMNLVALRRGEALFLDAGILHAYLDGLGVELMAASDNVLRGGLTPKHVDVPELMRIVDPRPAPPPRLRPRGEGGAAVFDPGIDDFVLTRATPTPEREVRVALRGPAIVVVTAGAVRVSGASGARSLTPGGAVFATADERVLVVSGTGEAFVAQQG